MDLLNLGPQAANPQAASPQPASPQAGSPRSGRAGGFQDWLRPAREPGVPLPRGRAALRGVLLTIGILCIVPQGLVPIGFNLLGVDPQVKVWFAARYLEQDLQVPAAAAFIAVGLLAILFGGAIGRSR
jgi:hypothetical protein